MVMSELRSEAHVRTGEWEERRKLQWRCNYKAHKQEFNSPSPLKLLLPWPVEGMTTSSFEKLNWREIKFGFGG
jgi:hypothetical protein